MEDYSVIQGQSVLEVLLALLSVLITFYVYLSWKSSVRRASVAKGKPHDAIPNLVPEVDREPHPIFCTPALTPVPAKKEKFAIGDWLAPIVVWAAVLWITLAVVSLMLGES